MGRDPYASGLLTHNPYDAKSDLTGHMCTLLNSRMDDRGLELIPQISRALCAGEVHEILRTDEDAGPKDRVAHVFGLGHMVFEQGGVAVVGDTLRVGAFVAGTIIGFDETHYPNHYNIVLRAPDGDTATGGESGVGIGDPVLITTEPAGA